MTVCFEVQIREEHAKAELVCDKESKRCYEVDSQPIRVKAYKMPDIAGKANHNILSSKSKDMAGFLSWSTVRTVSVQKLCVVLHA